MSAYTQANRPIAVSTPLGPDTLLLISVAGEEALSALFRFELEMLALARVSVPFDQVLGQSVTVTLELPDGSTRPINGIVSSFCQAEVVAGAQGRPTFIRYHAELVPRLWLLTKNFQSRIFQHLSIPDILKQVLADLDVSFQIQGTFQPREYCVQYRESDFQFASRLMEEEGIYILLSAHGERAHDGRGKHAGEPCRRPGTDPDHVRDRRGRHAARGPHHRLEEATGGPVGKIHPLGSLFRAARQESGGDPALAPIRPGWDRQPQSVGGEQWQSRDLRIPGRITPSGSTGSAGAGESRPPTSRKFSPTTPARPASGCRRKPPAR